MWLLDKLLGKKGKTESIEVKQTDPSELELVKAQPKQVIVKEEVKAESVKETIETYEEEFKNKIGFNVAGVTQENEKGQDIQTILKRVANGYKNGYTIDSFQGYSASELKEYYEDSHISEFEGEYLDDVLKFVPEPDNQYDKNAIKVYLNDHNGVDQHIGYVKKAVNKKLLDFIHRDMIDSTTIEFVGGRTKYINYDYLDDKSTIETRELTRGVSVIVTIKEDIQAERNAKGKELEKEGDIEEAKRLYLLNVEEDYIGSHPYNRLAIIYRKEKDYDNEIKVLEKAIEVHKRFKERSGNNAKLEQFQNRLDRAYELKAKHEEKTV